MRKLTLKLFSDFLSPDGKYVDYKGIGTSKSFEVRTGKGNRLLS